MTEVKREMKEKEKSMNQTKLSVSNLDLYYGNFHALKNINLELPEKEITAFIGPSGCGKSTLLKSLNRMNDLIEGCRITGQVLLDGEDITGMNITERAKAGISFAFQQPVRFKGITVRDLITLAAGKNLTTAEACSYLSEVGLCAQEYINREVNASLSGGELKRIEIASVLARASKLSVFDEPEAGIDLWSFQNLISVFERMRQVRSDRTILVISHQERILNIADEIIVLAEGKIVSHGSRAEILPTLLGTPSAVSACAQLEKTTGKEGKC